MQSLCFFSLSSSLHLLSKAVTWEVSIRSDAESQGSKAWCEMVKKCILSRKSKTCVFSHAPFSTMFLSWGNQELISLIMDDYIILINGLWLLANYHASVAALPYCHGRDESQSWRSDSESTIHYVYISSPLIWPMQGYYRWLQPCHSVPSWHTLTCTLPPTPLTRKELLLKEQ